jgi:hypothetical protein
VGCVDQLKVLLTGEDAAYRGSHPCGWRSAFSGKAAWRAGSGSGSTRRTQPMPGWGRSAHRDDLSGGPAPVVVHGAGAVAEAAGRPRFGQLLLDLAVALVLWTVAVPQARCQASSMASCPCSGGPGDTGRSAVVDQHESNTMNVRYSLDVTRSPPIWNSLPSPGPKIVVMASSSADRIFAPLRYVGRTGGGARSFARLRPSGLRPVIGSSERRQGGVAARWSCETAESGALVSRA